ncbi:hypothetical protein ACIO7M_32520 [Streptomyces toxytricini]|uniref:Uncharacterized protein n=1 Tax=Streptomyces toxytricini TaxID=67369 RepID=A0ABW8ERJ4_STRT5
MRPFHLYQVSSALAVEQQSHSPESKSFYVITAYPKAPYMRQVTEPTDAVLTSGVLARLVDLAVASRNPGAAPLEDELQRFSWLLQDTHAIAWVMPFDVVASLLDALADEYGTARFGTRPAAFRDRLSRAAGDEPVDAFLHSLAELVRDP